MYTVSLILSVLFIIVIYVFVSRQCERIFRMDNGTADCGVGIGWFGLAGACVVIGVVAGYMLYREIKGKE